MKIMCVFVIVKIDEATKLSFLVQRLQEERAAAALNIFIYRASNVDDTSDLQPYVKNGLNISLYTIKTVSL